MDEVAETLEGGAINYIELTADLVSAYVSNNHLQPNEIPSLIASMHAALTGLGQDGAAGAPAMDKPTPSQIRKSITHDALISFIDGRPYKTLKRHITGNGMTVEEYRERYGLPRDYPVTAANYSEQRSKLATELGLGKQRKNAAPKAAEPVATAPKKPKRVVGRPRKAKADAEA
ncbi:MucR family transcriptional regulator [Methylobacterium pseudosasicola]|uniref:Transcriptional regulator, MucR family n=1 Tax=Methylobacterium pseudosasicola TaxID=582667 RepID=A0A1I4UMJ6_9HYPH|nr:MucR family transcriptional regulator [Methylobacterium pseudosasicola]SFM90224.1 transcriptional regulator, MucR family [Methylobacterium pseudosasicola]